MRFPLLAPALAAAIPVLALPHAASAAVSFSITFGNVCDLCTLGQRVINIINTVLVPVLFAVAFIAFLYGIAQAYIFSGGDAEAIGRGHQLMLWGIIGFFVMLSLWGLVNIVANTAGISGGFAPPTPIYEPTF